MVSFEKIVQKFRQLDEYLGLLRKISKTHQDMAIRRAKLHIPVGKPEIKVKKNGRFMM